MGGYGGYGGGYGSMNSNGYGSMYNNGYGGMYNRRYAMSNDWGVRSQYNNDRYAMRGNVHTPRSNFMRDPYDARPTGGVAAY